MKSTAKAMADSGCCGADIGDYLSSRGCSGTLTSHRLKYNVDAVRQELEDYTVISQPGETEAEALLRVLKETKCRFIYLYTTAPTDITAPAELTVATSDNHEATLREGQSLPDRGLNFMSDVFFERAPKVDAHILAAFRELEDVPDRAQSTVANRYPDDPKRRQRPKTPPLKRTGAAPKRPAAAGGGHSASHAIIQISDTGAGAAPKRPAYTIIQISDSEDENEIRNGGASSSD